MGVLAEKADPVPANVINTEDVNMSENESSEMMNLRLETRSRQLRKNQQLK